MIRSITPIAHAVIHEYLRELVIHHFEERCGDMRYVCVRTIRVFVPGFRSGCVQIGSEVKESLPNRLLLQQPAGYYDTIFD